MPVETLLQRLFADAQEAFLAAVDHVPNPGRGGSIGSLNPAGWTVMHASEVQEGWIAGLAAATPIDAEIERWFETSEHGPPQDHTPPYDAARAVFERMAERSAAWVSGWSWDELCQPVTLPEGAPDSWPNPRTYLVARSVAHAFIHAGDLTVVASLMARPDLGLPGDLPYSSPPTAEHDPSVPVVAALLRDAYVELRRVAEVMPQPAVVGAMDRLNPVSHTLAHVMAREDRLWNQVAQGREPDPGLTALKRRGAEGEPVPLPWDECLGALDRVEASVGPWLDALTPEEGATPMKWRDDSSYAAQIARSAAHVFSHAGEMMAHASLYGAGDLGQPGELAYVREATRRAASEATSREGAAGEGREA